MALCIVALTPSGIVLTADSREVYRNLAGAPRTGSDHALKLFKFTEKCGVVAAGRASFPDARGIVKSTSWFVEDFSRGLRNKTSMAVKTLAQQLNDFISRVYIEPEEARLKTQIEAELTASGGGQVAFQRRPGAVILYSYVSGDKAQEGQYPMETVDLIVAGYDPDGIGRAYLVRAPDGVVEANSRTTEAGGELSIGQNDVMLRITKGWSPELPGLPGVEEAKVKGVDVPAEAGKLEYIVNWGAMGLLDAIDFCAGMTRITETVQKYSDGTYLRPGGTGAVGGPLDVATITAEEGFQWVRRKQSAG
jgi:hypothetical protein